MPLSREERDAMRERWEYAQKAARGELTPSACGQVWSWFYDYMARGEGIALLDALTEAEAERDANAEAVDYWVNLADRIQAERDEAVWLVEHAVASWSGHAEEWWRRQRAFLARLASPASTAERSS